MKIKDRIKFELELNKLKFKREGFEDGSSYWFNKQIKYKDFQLNIYVQFNKDILALQVRNRSDFYSINKKITYNSYFDTIKEFKLNLKNVKSLIKKYGK
jgi:hypothetical protein